MADSPQTRLRVLDQGVSARVDEIESAVPDWPCRAGCDHCCRSLGAPLLITEVEFARLWTAVEALPDAAQCDLEQRIAALDPGEPGPHVCPLLDRDSGRCRVYEGRPIACRTYGYYAGRDGDYWCDKVTAHVIGRRDGFVAGNQIAIDRLRDHQLGKSRSLPEHVAALGGSTS